MGIPRQWKGTPGFRQWVEPLWELGVSMSLWQPLGRGPMPRSFHTLLFPSQCDLSCVLSLLLYSVPSPGSPTHAAGPSKKWKCEVPCSKIIKKKFRMAKGKLKVNLPCALGACATRGVTHPHSQPCPHFSAGVSFTQLPLHGHPPPRPHPTQMSGP